jgi:hypothetical protein
MGERHHPCACGCGKLVTRKTEGRHEAGQGRSSLILNILTQNRSLINHKRDSQTRRKKSSRSFAKQQVVGRPAPVRRSLVLAKDPAHNSATGEEFDNTTFDDLPGDVHDQGSPSRITLEEDLDFPMGEASPSGGNNDPPGPSSPLSVPLSGNADEYGLSNLRRSRRVAECVKRIGRFRWGSNHQRQFMVDDDDDGENHEEDEDEYETPCAELGQEGVSVWDLLGESFLKEASRLGVSASIHSFIDV